MKKVNVKIINKSSYDLPAYSDPGSSGMDVRSNFSGTVTLYPGCSVLVPTGLYFKIPLGYEFQVRPRSGLAAKKGITVLNTPGTIDSSYRGELKVILYNSGSEQFVINPGDRIAQIVLAEVPICVWDETEEFTEEDLTDDRGGGFGHSGI